MFFELFAPLQTWTGFDSRLLKCVRFFAPGLPIKWVVCVLLLTVSQNGSLSCYSFFFACSPFGPHKLRPNKDHRRVNPRRWLHTQNWTKGEGERLLWLDGKIQDKPAERNLTKYGRHCSITLLWCTSLALRQQGYQVLLFQQKYCKTRWTVYAPCLAFRKRQGCQIAFFLRTPWCNIV